MKSIKKISVLSLMIVAMLICLCFGVCAIDDYDYLTFTLNEDGTSYTVADCDAYYEGKVVIPVEYKGLPVTKIGNSCFEDCSLISEVIIPNGIIEIGNDAFCRTNMESIDIPDSVVSMGDSAFTFCYSLKSVKLSENLRAVSNRMFFHCHSLEEITIPASVKSLEYLAFDDCTNLKTINLKEGLERIEDCFGGCNLLKEFNIPSSVKRFSISCCDGIESIVIPDTVETLGGFARCKNLKYIKLGKKVEKFINYGYVDSFEECYALEYIDVSEDNQWFTSVNGVLYDKKQETLVRYPQNKPGEEFFENNARIINVGAFNGANHLKKITLGNTVENVKKKAFSECENLEKIVFGENLKAIDNPAFSYSLKLSCIEVASTNIYYNTEDGVLFNGDKSVLLKYPVNKKDKIYNIPDTVVEISEEAFSENQYIEIVNIGDNVETLGENTFYNCDNLVTVNMGDGIIIVPSYAFYDCNKLKNIKLPSFLEKICYNTFYNCSSLEYIEFPDSVIEISGSFSNCTSLDNVVLGNKVEFVSGFDNCTSLKNITLSENLKRIGPSAFMNCSALEKIELPDSVEIFDYHTFSGCKNLKEINIPKSLKCLTNGAFSECTSLKEIEIPETLEKIDELAFVKSGLEKVVIANSVTTIEEGAFFQCGELKSVIISDNVSYIPDRCFEDCTKLESVTLGKNIKSINWHAFYKCSDLKDINLPSSVEKIGEAAFYNCSSIEKIVLSPNVKTIEPHAFNGCIGVKSLTVSEGVEEIGMCAFLGCDINSVYLPETVNKIGKWSIGYTGFYIVPETGYSMSNAVYDIYPIESFTIYGIEDTVAEKYAKADGFEFKVYKAEEHEHTLETKKENVIVGTCFTEGSCDLVTYCTLCGAEINRESISTEKISHNYKDGICENCGFMSAEGCSCRCHSSNPISKIIYRVISFFWKIIRINNECACGAVHY